MTAKVLKFDTRREWLEARNDGIGASEIAAVSGISSYRGALTVYYRKRGLLEREPMSDAQRFGLLLEPVIAGEFRRHTGHSLTRCQRTLYVHPEYEWARCTPDFLIDGQDALLEVKTASWYTAREFGRTGTDQVPMEYCAQCVWQLGVTGRSLCHLAVLISNADYRTYEIPFEPELWETLLADARDFWVNHVLPGNPPDPDHLPSTAKALEGIYPNVREPVIDFASADETYLIADLVKVRDMKKRLKQREDLLKNKLKSAIGDREGLECGAGKVTWLEDTSRGGRTFRVKESKNGE